MLAVNQVLDQVPRPGTRLPGRARIPGRNAAVRTVAHVLAWAPFMCAGLFVMRHGWRPVSDAAAIGLRSWDVMTAHGPLVGQASRMARGVFDPGPLEYWLLALPVRLDPLSGLLWGAALWCMLSASLMVEAARSVAGERGGLLASGIVLGTVAWMPGVALQPYWNPWFGVMFLLAALAAGLAVLAGRRGWWPVVVVAASIAAQAHLMFAVVSAALVLLAFVVGMVDCVRDQAEYRWAVCGLAGGVACWMAPVIQEFTGRSGNLTALLHVLSAHAPRTGLDFGLKALAGSAEPPAAWWTSLQSQVNLSLIDGRSAGFGVLTLTAMVTVLVAAVGPLRSRRLAALAGISLLASIAALGTYASIAVHAIPETPSRLDTLNYLMILMFPVGILAWLTAGFALALTGRKVLSQVHAPAELARHRTAGYLARGNTHRGAKAAVRWGVSAVGLAVAGVLAMASALTVTADWRQFPGVADHQVVHAVSVASSRIERRLSRQPIALSVICTDPHYRKRRLLLGLAFALTARGYAPELTSSGWELGPRYVFRGSAVPSVLVLVRGSDIAVSITRPTVRS